MVSEKVNVQKSRSISHIRRPNEVLKNCLKQEIINSKKKKRGIMGHTYRDSNMPTMT